MKGKEINMLCITMKRGEYFTVDGETVILFDQLSGERAHLTIHAPRNVAIVRGAVLERNGNPPPPCLAKLPARKRGATARRPFTVGTTSGGGPCIPPPTMRRRSRNCWRAI